MRKIQCVMQRDAMQCGVASLCMVANYYGLKRDLSWFEQDCRPTSEGVSMKAIKYSAQKAGMDAVGVAVTTERLCELPMPSILHWDQSHFVVLCHTSKQGKRFHVADPAKGKITYTREEFDKHWISKHKGTSAIGMALLIQPGKEFKMGKENSVKSRKSLKFLIGYFRKYRKHFLLIFLGLLIGCLLQLIFPFLTQAIVDVGIKNSNIGFIWLVLLGELMIVIGRTAIDFVRRWILLHISMRINVSLISDFLVKLLKLPMSFFDTKLLGDLIQRIGDHSRVQDFLTGQALNLLFTLLSFVVFGTVLFIYSGLIFSIFLISSIGYAVWVSAFLHRRKILDYERFEQEAINQSRTYQLLTSMQEIKLQNCERRRRWEWEDTQADIFCIQMKSLKMQQMQEAGSVFINEVKNILITVFAATAVIHGEMTLGAMLAVQFVIGQLNSPIEQLMSFIYSYQDVKISLDRINEIHERENEEKETSNLCAFQNACDIAFSNVNFKYDPYTDTNVLDNVSFEIPANKVTAIVGTSGSGKTTLVKLMLGYYPPDSGILKISGNPISNYSMSWWRHQCGVVMQDGVIFSESIARNIAVDDNNIDEEKMVRAARLANIHDYISDLPLGYGTKIGRDGVGLSQGQKQRILIARAVYRDPSYIFLDEATNALDAKNERIIIENLANFYKGRTVVVVAHRLSTVKEADQIIVLEHGKIAEIGNHDQLIKEGGVYFNLIKNQLEIEP